MSGSLLYVQIVVLYAIGFLSTPLGITLLQILKELILIFL